MLSINDKSLQENKYIIEVLQQNFKIEEINIDHQYKLSGKLNKNTSKEKIIVCTKKRNKNGKN
ncbi:hypothetical protein [Spiroplasma endosymbiont of Nebria brevicollis]|uniref:hypothetical protein n=1 Tax=Spiroplasma endosymbiont of Nebria brevicollis TaxID=3066284 RepID=UPI00313B77BA